MKLQLAFVLTLNPKQKVSISTKLCVCGIFSYEYISVFYVHTLHYPVISVECLFHTHTDTHMQFSMSVPMTTLSFTLSVHRAGDTEDRGASYFSLMRDVMGTRPNFNENWFSVGMAITFFCLFF